MAGLLSGFDGLISSILPGVSADRLEGFFQGEDDILGPLVAALRGPAAAPGKTVVLVPGVLGSSMRDRGRLLWLSPDLSAIDGLAFSPGDDDAGDHDAAPGAQVEPDALLWEAYSLMSLYFTHVSGFEVIPVPFDWRRSFDRLADDLFAKLPPAGRFSIVAHSMGCLVARRCVQRHPGIVDRIDHAVFMAAPFQGSYVPLSLFAGQDWFGNLFRFVSRVSPGAILAGCPGFLQMVPDATVFPDAAPLLQDLRWSNDTLPPQLVKRAQSFAADFRRPTGAAAVDDDKLMRKASLVIGLGLETPSKVVFDEQGNLSHFATDWLGDTTVPARSAWDDRAKGKYRTGAPHPFVAQDWSVIRGAAALVISDGADVQGELETIGAMPGTEAVTVGDRASAFDKVSRLEMFSEPVAGPVAEPAPRGPSMSAKPRGFDDRVAAGKLNNADLHFLLSGTGPSAPPAPAKPLASTLEAKVELGGDLRAQLGFETAFEARTLGAPGLDVAERWLRALAAADASRGGRGFRFEKAPTLTLVSGIQATPALAAWPAGEAAGRLPAFCGEVITAATARDDRRIKLPLYARAGIAWVWLLDPRIELLEIYRCKGGRPTLVEAAQAGDVLRVAPFGIDLALGALWRGVTTALPSRASPARYQ